MRAIIQHPDILSGRWHFEGTSIPIAALLADYRHGRGATLDRYRFMQLTNDEIDAALAFAFPVVCEPAVEFQYAAIMLRCECGEEIQTTVTWPGSADIVCVCGRCWRTPVGVERSPPPPSQDAM